MNCTAALSNAWDSMVRTLFRPFSLPLWFALALPAWLANIGANGGGFDFPFSGDMFKETGRTALIVGIAGIGILGIALAVLCMWLRARGRCSWIHVIVNGPQTASPLTPLWNRYAVPGNRFFVFSLILWMLCLIPFLAISCLIAAPLARDIFANPGAMPGLELILMTCGGLGVLFLCWLPFWFVLQLFHDFGLLLMIRDYGTAAPAAFGKVWRKFWELPWDMFKYILMLFALNVIFSTVLCCVLILGCCLLCIPWIMLMLPYLWAVLCLPWLHFREAFTIECARYLGPEFSLEPDPPENAGA